jgi:hypothetical protein
MAIAKILGLAALVLGVSRHLAAEEGAGPAPLRFGAEILYSTPRKDFQSATTKAGVGLGLFAENDLGSGNAFQTRFDYVRYPQINSPGTGLSDFTGPSPLTLSMSSASVAVDLRHHLPTAGLEPVFVQAGILFIRYEFQTSTAPDTGPDAQGVNPAPTLPRAKDSTPFKMGFDLGLGYNLTPDWALTVRYTSMTSASTTFATLDALVSHRF